MKAYLTLIVVVLFAACAAAPKCPVSEADFASATSDLAKLQSEVNDLESELADAKARGDEFYDMALAYEAKNAELQAMLKSEPAAVSKTVVAEVEMESNSESDALYDEKAAELMKLLAKAEAINAKLEAETEVKVKPLPPKPVLSPVPPIYGYGISPAPFGAAMTSYPPAPFTPFPASNIGYSYAPPSGSPLNIHINGEGVKGEAYFRVWVNGVEIAWVGGNNLDNDDVYLPFEEDGVVTMLPLFPPGGDGYIPVAKNDLTYRVEVQVCYIIGSTCVSQWEKHEATKIKDVTNRNVMLKTYD